MVKNKKAAIILYPAIIGIIIGLAGFFIFKYASEPFEDPPVGTKSVYLLKATNRAERIFYYIDQSAQLSANRRHVTTSMKHVLSCFSPLLDV